MNFMDTIYAIIGYPLGWVMWACYQLFHNYGIALILFTVFTKLVLLPFGIKQQKSQVKMALFQPKIQEIQKKYGNNKAKMQEEMAALYQKEGYNPMSGCAPLLIQFPILFGLIDVIYRPLYHILRFSSEEINRAVEIAKTVITSQTFIDRNDMFLRQENLIMEGLRINPQAFADAMGQGFVDKVSGFNQNFLVWDLSQVPTWGLNLLILIPILSGITAFFVSRVSMKMSQQTTGNAPGMGGMNLTMSLVMPLMSVWIAFQVPAGVGLYWALSNLFSMFQTILLNKKYNPKELIEKAKAEEEQRKEEERRQRAEQRKLMQSDDYKEEQRRKAMKQKEINRMKLAEARKRDAEKYGEEYHDVTDDDLR